MSPRSCIKTDHPTLRAAQDRIWQGVATPHFYSEVAPHKECHVFFGPYKAAHASKTQVFPASDCTALEPFLIKVQRLIISNY